MAKKEKLALEVKQAEEPKALIKRAKVNMVLKSGKMMIAGEAVELSAEEVESIQAAHPETIAKILE